METTKRFSDRHCNTCATDLERHPAARKVRAGSFCSDSCEAKARPRVPPPLGVPKTPELLPIVPQDLTLACPACCGVLRKRGEVRVWVGLCGCCIRPEVRPCNLVASPTPDGYERGWYASGYGVDPEETEYPTEAGAVAAWRVALERRQREDDERAARPPITGPIAWEPAPAPERAPWRLKIDGDAGWVSPYHGALGAVLRAAAVRRSADQIERLRKAVDREIERVTIGDAGREVFGYALADSTPHPDRPGEHHVGTQPRAGKSAAARALNDALDAHGYARSVGEAHAAFARFDYPAGAKAMAETGAYHAVEQRVAGRVLGYARADAAQDPERHLVTIAVGARLS